MEHCLIFVLANVLSVLLFMASSHLFRAFFNEAGKYYQIRIVFSHIIGFRPHYYVILDVVVI